MKLSTLTAMVLVGCTGCSAVAFAQQPTPPAEAEAVGFPATTIWRIPLPTKQEVPLVIPTTPEDTTFIELPVPLADWMGRGFTLDPRLFVGDFHLRLVIGGTHIGVVPLAAGARRTLHLILEDNRLLTLDLAPAVSRDFAWRAVVFQDTDKMREAVENAAKRERERMARPAVVAGSEAVPRDDDDVGGMSVVRRDDAPPESRYQRPNARTMDGMISLLRASVGLSAERVSLFSKANPSLQFVKHPGVPVNYGLYDLSVRTAIRDDITDTLGIAVAVTNLDRNMKLLFDPAEWIVRVGERVYRLNAPGTQIMFPGTLNPGQSDMVYLVIGRAPDGVPTRLLPDNDFRVTAKLLDQTPALPVQSLDLSSAFR